ncbi:hypothetical protein TCAL_05897 [Tigriopus californicus]|uniref:SAM domain-containing protein n=2 Tax=Tigriopus californicus TaxID=6832 RepID=A0A553PN91_TIGCA|nr:hypothetical protein TCAL_05897 [Tigriopus californicus]
MGMMANAQQQQQQHQQQPKQPPAAQPIKSYSDFMRSLAAKYNNNESSSSSPPANDLAESLKLGFSPLNPFLGFPSPFRMPLNSQGYPPGLNPLLQHASKDEQIRAAAAAMMSSIPGMGFPSMIDQLSSTQALLNLAAARTSTTMANSESGEPPMKIRKRDSTTNKPIKNEHHPLDLSGSNPPSPSSKSEADQRIDTKETQQRQFLLHQHHQHHQQLQKHHHRQKQPEPEINHPERRPDSPEMDAAVLQWTVSDVVDFVDSIDMCKEYSSVFQEHNIDGPSLALLTDDHLTKRLGLKLGPALKLRSMVQSKFHMASSSTSSSKIALGACIHCTHCQERLKSMVQRDKKSKSVVSQRSNSPEPQPDP